MDNYEKSTNGIIHDLAEKNTVDNLQQYDLSDSVDAPDICTAPMDVSLHFFDLHFLLKILSSQNDKIPVLHKMQ